MSAARTPVRQMPAVEFIPSSRGHLGVQEVVSMPGKTHGGRITPGRTGVYEALRAKGYSKKVSAKMANAGKTKAGRKAMARKAARHR